MYENWNPSKRYPHIEEQVIKDLLETNDISREVLDKLNGKEELKGKLFEILEGYRNFAIREYRQDASEAMARRLSEAAAPIVAKWLEGMMLPPPLSFPARRVPVGEAGSELGWRRPPNEIPEEIGEAIAKGIKGSQ